VATTDSATAAAPDSARTAPTGGANAAPIAAASPAPIADLSAQRRIVIDTARARARRDSVQRYNDAAAARALARSSDTASRAPTRAPTRPAVTPSVVRRAPRADPQDLMMLNDSLSSGGAEPAPEPPSLPQPTGP